MAFDLSKVVGSLGDDIIGKCGEPFGLDTDQSVRLARSLATKFNLGGEEAVKAVAEDTGIDEEVVTSFSKKLIEAGKEQLLDQSGAGAAIDKAKEEAMAAVQNQAKGLFGKLFGKA